VTDQEATQNLLDGARASDSTVGGAMGPALGEKNAECAPRRRAMHAGHFDIRLICLPRPSRADFVRLIKVPGRV
jgi:hypothetical protein